MKKLAEKMAEKPQEKCNYNAPIICYKKTVCGDASWVLIQGCCNHWDCARCGIVRAKQEYWKIVNGAQALSHWQHELFFLTITCRGGELTKSESEEGYLEWTDRLNTSMRNHASSKNIYWSYVAVTERQKRGMPHSHYITTFCPIDGINVTLGTNITIRSEWLQNAIIRSGLGHIYDLNKIRSAAAVSRYVAKYLFKESLHTEWPKGWKRVRYSNSWPKTEYEGKAGDAFAIVKKEDWLRLKKIARNGERVSTSDKIIHIMAQSRGYSVSLREVNIV